MKRMSQTKLSVIAYKNGEIRRRITEECQAYCKICDLVVSDWIDHKTAVRHYLDHLMLKHEKFEQ